MVGLVLLLLLLVAAASAQNCSVSPADKLDCHIDSPDACTSGGCCWQPVNPNPNNEPWCFRPSNYSPCSPAVQGSSAGNPFSPSDVARMQAFFQANLDLNGTGAVLASPDADVLSGGSYRYHWSRDGALSMRALSETNTNRPMVIAKMLHYARFLDTIHNQPDPFGINILTEPKFLLSGQVYPGGWCRPQNDGPGVRATTLINLAKELLQTSNGTAFVKRYLWTGSPNVEGGGIIKRDLDWVSNPNNWQLATCDLWEEVQSDDFFWNRMVHNRALYMGTVFAQLMGDASSAALYANAQQQINATLLKHWNGNFVYESVNRPLDGATMGAFNEGIEDGMPTPFTPTSVYVAGTIQAEINAFCAEYPLNNIDTANGVPGVLIGRYPGDVYGGGNPWILLSAYLAQSFYRGAQYTQSVRALPEPEAMRHWRAVMPQLRADVTHEEFATQLLQMGDGVMQRIYFHVMGAGFHLSEQLDRVTGVEKSATDLTWSYGTVLKALQLRSRVAGA